MKKLYVDDLRPVPDFSWEPAFNYFEALILLQHDDYDIISLDHDIDSFDDNGKEYTGYDILNYLECLRIEFRMKIPHIFVHTANAAVAAKMQAVADKLNKMGDPK